MKINLCEGECGATFASSLTGISKFDASVSRHKNLDDGGDFSRANARTGR
ncbi:hypothetical protein [Pandoraea vervacti]|nr:hypothetical protein [Pandoraea vervacti]